jgi:hypothetical protein
VRTASPTLILNAFYSIFGSCKTDSESGSGSRLSQRTQRPFFDEALLYTLTACGLPLLGRQGFDAMVLLRSKSHDVPFGET